jgi:hypothetical protein
VALHADGHTPTLTVVADWLLHNGGDPTTCHPLMDTGTGAIAKHLADVIRYSRLRRLAEVTAEATDAAVNLADPDDIIAELATAIAVTRRTGDLPDCLYSFDDLIDRPSAEQAPWVIEGLLREGWRVVLVAAEGSGKMTWLRQIALCAANGVHPMTWQDIPPVDTLVVDLENPLDVVHDGAARIIGQVRKEQGDEYRKHGAWLFHEPGGMDLRNRADRAKLEVTLAEVRPKLVVVGPLYKAFRRGKGESDEDAAGAVAAVLDDLRTRFGFALLVEHHAPKGSGIAGRDLVPFGSSLWLRWPEFGLTLEATDSTKRFKVGRFRRDRVEAVWPREIEWAQRFPFNATFDRSMP